MRIDFITIFPETIEPFLATSIPAIAAEKGLVTWKVHDLRKHARNRHAKVDDKPFGGGPGMVFTPGPVFRAVEAVRAEHEAAGLVSRFLMMTPQGAPFTQAQARGLAGEDALVLLCGHYEGYDERIRLGLNPLEISLGDFVLTGGELPGLAVADAVVRLLPGVLGSPESGRRDSFSRNLLGFPQYTRPREFRGMEVPEVLLSGDHARIEQWREAMALERTRKRREDLLKG
jgi:tRNA (guanine37-N1)-methyltransferase